MKKSLKKILSVLTVAVILLFTLSISSFADDSPFQYVTVHFGLHTTFYDNVVDDVESVRDAISSIQIDYIDYNNNYRTLDYGGKASSFIAYYDGVYEDRTVYIYNPSYYEFYFDLCIPGGDMLTTRARIPAASSDGPGVLILNLGDDLSYNVGVPAVSCWFKTSMPPVYVGMPDSGSDPIPDYNTGVINFFAELPSGENVSLGSVTPPDNHTGSYSFTYASVMNSFQLDDWQLQALAGYQISPDFDLNSSYVINNDVAEIRIPYVVSDASARTLRFELCDVFGTVVHVDQIKVSYNLLVCNTPIYGDYTTFPYSVDIDVSLSTDQVQVFKCYIVDETKIMTDSYDRGYKDGFALGEASAPDVGDAWQDGYDNGLFDGLCQNKLTASQIQKYTKDYNAITAFFDGMFGWMKDMIFEIGDGIQFKGIKAIDIFSSVIIIAVVIWGYKTLF